MAVKLAGILVEMAANVARLEKDMKGAQRAVRDASRQMQGAANLARTALGALGVALGANAFVGLIKGSIDAQDRLLDLSKTAGVTVERLGGLGYAAKLSGSDLETLATGMVRLARNMADTQIGTGEAREAFESLGIKVTDAAGKLRTTDEVVLEIADKFSKMESATQRAAFAQELMGRGGAALVPLLGEGREAIEAMIREWEELSGITTESATRASDFNDKLDKLKVVGGGMAATMASQMLPALSDFVTWLTESGRQTDIAKTAADALVGTFKTLAMSAAGVKFVFQEMGRDIGALAAAFGAFVTGEWSLASEILRLRGEDQVKAAEEFSAKVRGIWEDTELTIIASAKNNTESVTAFSQKGADETAKHAQKVKALLDDLRGVDTKFTDNLRMLEEAYAKGLIPTLEEYVALVEKLILTTTELGQEETRRREEGVKALAQAEKERLDVLKKATDAVEDELDAAKRANEEYGKSRTEIARLTLAKMEARLASLDFANATIEEVNALEKQIEKQKELIDVLSNTDAKEAIAEGEAKRREEAEKTADTINKSLTDALLRGFESGKDAAENFRDTLKNMFRTLVLRIPIQFLLAPISNALAGVVGGFTGGFGGGGGGAMGALSGASSLGNLFGIGSSLAGLFADAGVISGAAIGNLAIDLFGSGAAGAGFAIGSALPAVGAALAIAGAAGLFGGNKSPATGIGVGARGTVGLGGSDLSWVGRSQNAYQQFAWPTFDHFAAIGVSDQAREMVEKVFAPWIAAFEEAGLNPERVRQFRGNVDFLIPANVPWEVTPAKALAQFETALQDVTRQLAQEFGPELEKVQRRMSLEAAAVNLERTMAGAVRGLPQALGITGLEQFQLSLRTSDFYSPAARVQSARQAMNEAFQRAIRGDLSAVEAFPQLAQQVLSIGRDVYASGPEYGRLFTEVNTQLQYVLTQQRSVQADILKDIDVSILEASRDQIGELRAGFKAMVEQLEGVRTELRKLQAAA